MTRNEDYVDPFMAQNVAENEQRQADSDKKAKAKKQRLVKEALLRNATQVSQARMAELAATRQQRIIASAGPNPSAVVQQNNQEADWEAVYTNDLSRQERLLDAEQQQSIAAAAAEANPGVPLGPRTIEEEKKHIEIKVKEMSKEAEAQRKYITDVQAYLYNNMQQITQYFAKLDKKEKIADKRPNIHRLDDPNLQKGTYINLVSNRGPIKDGRALYSEFVHATPDQLAHLVPLLRFFIVDQDGNEDEIYFSDHASGDYAKTIADLRSSGDINKFLSSTREQKGSDAGIKSFTWNYHNKHEGDFIIEANLELYFGTLAELANINYLRFLFPTGNSTALATELIEGSESLTNAERGRAGQKSRTIAQRITKLDNRIKSIKKILGSPTEDNIKVPMIEDKKLRSSRSKNFRQLKVIVGWAVPGGSEAQLRKSFKNTIAYESFMESLRATNKAIFLNLSDYNVEFQQEGTTTLSLSYLGSSDNYLASAASDVFGSNNLDDVDSKLLYKVTNVPITGFASYEGRILDLRKTTQQALDDLGGSITAVASVAHQGPYIQSVIRRQKKGAMQHLMKNADGELTIGVTLAGLKAAQELQSLELQMAQLQKKGDESPRVEAIRLRGQLLTLLYDRAETIRLRDIYSRYLEGLLGSEYIRKARIETPDSPNNPPKLILQDDALSPKEREALLRKRSFGSGELDQNGIEIPMPEGDDPPLTSPFESTQVYYMRLGDILHRAMETSGLRDDISIILGNTGRLNVPHSLYDIPITIDQFGQFFYNRIVSRKLRSYPFRYFMNDILKLVARVVNQDPRIFDRIAFDYTVVSGLATDVEDLPFALEKSDLIKIGKSQEDPLSNANMKFQNFYPIFENNISHVGRVGDRVADEAEGIYHYVIGSNRGLAKTFNFSRQETEYFREMLIESNNLDDKIQALFLPQNVTLTLYGNTLHKNGDLIFIDSRPSLGSFAGPVLGIGGYYRVIRSTHEISNRGYETSLECVFELRVQPDKSQVL